MRISLDDIELDTSMHVRVAINEDIVAHYAERMAAGDDFPPVTVFEERGRRYWGDGFHRTLAAKKAGRTEIEAEVRSGTREDALWYALGANRTHGVPMTTADRRHAVLLALRALPDRSQSVIAEQVGCSRSYVEKIKAEQDAGEVDTSVNVRVTGKDGKSYPATRKRGARSTGGRVRTKHTRSPLSQLKRYWQIATAEDQQAFVAWIDRERSDHCYAAVDSLHNGAGSD